MAKTVHTGWRKITPGKCRDCGFDTDYGCNGSGHVLCSCSPDFDESYDTTEAGEPEADEVTRDDGRVMSMADAVGDLPHDSEAPCPYHDSGNEGPCNHCER